MNRLGLGVLALCACCAGLTGCGTTPLTPSANVLASTAEIRTGSAAAARDAIIPGKSIKSDVSSALGTATVISFDSGYEVWIYKYKDAATLRPQLITELVVLFAPSGVATKARLRTGPPAPRG